MMIEQQSKALPGKVWFTTGGLKGFQTNYLPKGYSGDYCFEGHMYRIGWCKMANLLTTKTNSDRASLSRSLKRLEARGLIERDWYGGVHLRVK